MYIPQVIVRLLHYVPRFPQDRFAAQFGLNSRMVRNWEQGVRHPEGPAWILLQVIDSEPEAVMRALRG